MSYNKLISSSSHGLLDEGIENVELSSHIDHSDEIAKQSYPEEAKIQVEESNLDYFCLSTKTIETILGWVSLCLAVLSGASIGPMFRYMTTHGIPSVLAASWRCQCMCVCLFPLMLIERKFLKQDYAASWLDKLPGMKFPLYIYILISGGTWAGNLILWILSLNYTTIVRASLYVNMHPLILVIVMYLSGGEISKLEFIGVLCAIVGILVSGSDGIKEIMQGASNSSQARALFGDAMCFVGAFMEVIIVLTRQKIKRYVPLMQYTLATTSIVALTTSIVYILQGNASNVFCTRDLCLFGWVSSKWNYFMLLFGLYVGVFCIAGFNYAMQYVSPLIFSSVQLLDTAVTGVIGWIAGLEEIPEVKTWIGGIIVIFSVGIITIGEHSKIPTNAQNNLEVKSDISTSLETSSSRSSDLDKLCPSHESDDIELVETHITISDINPIIPLDEHEKA